MSATELAQGRSFKQAFSFSAVPKDEDEQRAKIKKENADKDKENERVEADKKLSEAIKEYCEGHNDTPYHKTLFVVYLDDCGVKQPVEEAITRLGVILKEDYPSSVLCQSFFNPKDQHRNKQEVRYKHKNTRTFHPFGPIPKKQNPPSDPFVNVPPLPDQMYTFNCSFDGSQQTTGISFTLDKVHCSFTGPNLAAITNLAISITMRAPTTTTAAAEPSAAKPHTTADMDHSPTQSNSKHEEKEEDEDDGDEDLYLVSSQDIESSPKPKPKKV